jgi:hypothetical protein
MTIISNIIESKEKTAGVFGLFSESWSDIDLKKYRTSTPYQQLSTNTKTLQIFICDSVKYITDIDKNVSDYLKNNELIKQVQFKEEEKKLWNEYLQEIYKSDKIEFKDYIDDHIDTDWFITNKNIIGSFVEPNKRHDFQLSSNKKQQLIDDIKSYFNLLIYITFKHKYCKSILKNMCGVCQQLYSLNYLLDITIDLVLYQRNLKSELKWAQDIDSFKHHYYIHQILSKSTKTKEKEEEKKEETEISKLNINILTRNDITTEQKWTVDQINKFFQDGCNLIIEKINRYTQSLMCQMCLLIDILQLIVNTYPKLYTNVSNIDKTIHDNQETYGERVCESKEICQLPEKKNGNNDDECQCEEKKMSTNILNLKEQT